MQRALRLTELNQTKTLNSCCSVKSRFLCNGNSPTSRFSSSLNNCDINLSPKSFDSSSCYTDCGPQKFCIYCSPCSFVNSCDCCYPCVPLAPYCHYPPCSLCSPCGFCNPCSFPDPCNFYYPCCVPCYCPPCNHPCYPESCSPCGSGDFCESPSMDNSNNFKCDFTDQQTYSSNDFVICDFDKVVSALLGSSRCPENPNCCSSCLQNPNYCNSCPENPNYCSSNNSRCLPPRVLAPGEVFLNPTYDIVLKNGVPFRQYPMSSGTRCCDEEFCSNTREYFYRYPIDPRFFSNRLKRDELDEKKDRDLEKEKKKLDQEYGENEEKGTKNKKGKKGKKK
ncbi:hypothetical protein HELRODRAFT_178104 [Helobdella robusta]|uniref:Uncharacterized protein n=1 Tax=Helobdella robusta TaxID=6412 RepID=T1FCR2_HELRO|nr:hypothetical protein HELRODRAFT_178104 [Helobdella robusta]ESN97319.1 hypothetical protein HELRODRAFT_178104 [Helobdella robusta]